jgi:hypothetical protein
MKRSMLSALALLCAMASAHAQNSSADDLARRAVEGRAVEAAIWGMPAVNTDLMYQAMLKLGGPTRLSNGLVCSTGATIDQAVEKLRQSIGQ